MPYYYTSLCSIIPTPDDNDDDLCAYFYGYHNDHLNAKMQIMRREAIETKRSETLERDNINAPPRLPGREICS